MQDYRFNFKLRRKAQPALDQNTLELKSEDFDDDEEFCQALASHALEMIKADRDYLKDTGGEDADSE